MPSLPSHATGHAAGRLALALAALLSAPAAFAADWRDLPTSFTAGGTEYGAKGTFQYDSNRFSDDERADGSAVFEDDDAWRRQEFYLFARRKGVFEATAGYDFTARSWGDAFVKLTSKVAGDVRLGHQKTLVGWEDYGYGTSSTIFLERSAAENAFYAGRRTGVEWTWTGLPGWRFALAGYDGEDLNGDNAGTTFAGRLVNTPVSGERRVVHLGASASRERRDDGIARFRARPNAALTDVRLVDSGRLASDHIDRVGLEAAWREGPLLLQAEWLKGSNEAPDGGHFDGRGWYAFASWSLTGEVRPYANAAFGNLKPKHAAGAVDVQLRYADLDLDDGSVQGGRQRDWTLGANWYWGRHLKLQANYVWLRSERAGVTLEPEILEARVQLAF
ncbi:OprO/OprP family phosphate-selective porin [Pseudoxanthomonas sp. 10H]|uniref:OprO/OprP family phosphate-selective porin n=1 Tax=Pseudoxanthomonas sp. 10H TaxID=3242729 RepID=UPI003555D7EA